jgi:hypothetical protein
MINIGGEGEVHRCTKAPIALLSNVFTSLPSSWFTVKARKVSTVLSTFGFKVFEVFCI